ncbi:MAG: S26 family signal peptidase [Bacteroidota bacterium]|nr:S26 family signal peptidase [Bacteroidota bacterium]
MIPYIFLLTYVFVLFACLWKLFQKAGRPAWAGFVPFYNIVVWLQISGKPWWWVFLFLVPGVNLLMFIIMNVNTSIILGERELKDHLVMVLLPWVKIPQLVFSDRAYVGPIPVEQRKRGMLGQWGDAILFAVIVATVFRTFTFEAFTIPTPSMEKSLLVGDYLFVSKLSYGPRLPMTPVTFPFTHHTMPFTASSPSFVNWFSLPYYRLPGFGVPERGDAVVFNFPEGDTVVANFQNQSYYQLVRDQGRAKIHDPNYRMLNMVEGRVVNIPTGGILVRPLDKKENYIKRCVAVAGDSVQVINGVLHVNGEAENFPPEAQFGYEFQVKEKFNEKRLKEMFDISPDDVQAMQNGVVNLPATPEAAEKLKGFNNVVSMQRQNNPQGFVSPYHRNPYFPNNDRYDWTEDNFGPLYIPKKGATVALDVAVLPVYERAIRVYEHNDLQVQGNTILINGEPATSYTFKQDYYWLMGDNRHRSQDSRFWGFVPHDHVVGKAVLVWFTKDPYTGIRWKRLFTLVK